MSTFSADIDKVDAKRSKEYGSTFGVVINRKFRFVFPICVSVNETTNLYINFLHFTL